MGYLHDLFNMVLHGDIKTINKRMLIGQDPLTGKSSYSTNIPKRIQNLQHCQTTTPEDHPDVLLYNINQLQATLNSGILTDDEETHVKQQLSLLLTKYQKLVNNNITTDEIEK